MILHGVWEWVVIIFLLILGSIIVFTGLRFKNILAKLLLIVLGILVLYFDYNLTSQTVASSKNPIKATSQTNLLQNQAKNNDDWTKPNNHQPDSTHSAIPPFPEQTGINKKKISNSQITSLPSGTLNVSQVYKVFGKGLIIATGTYYDTQNKIHLVAWIDYPCQMYTHSPGDLKITLEFDNNVMVDQNWVDIKDVPSPTVPPRDGHPGIEVQNFKMMAKDAQLGYYK